MTEGLVDLGLWVGERRRGQSGEENLHQLEAAELPHQLRLQRSLVELALDHPNHLHDTIDKEVLQDNLGAVPSERDAHSLSHSPSRLRGVVALVAEHCVC